MVDSLLKLCLGSRCTRNKVVCKVVYQPSKYEEHQWHCLFDIVLISSILRTEESHRVLTAPAPMAVRKHIPIRMKSK